MNQAIPKRFAIIGLPGSGKSTFAMKLGALLDIPVHHLDRHRFESDGKKKDKEEFLAIQKALLNEKSWIIEGCSASTFEMRFGAADTLIYFHFPRFLCIWRSFKRIFTRDKSLADTGCAKVINWRLVKYIWDFDKENSKQIRKLSHKYPRVNFHVFRNSKDATKFLDTIKKDRPHV